MAETTLSTLSAKVDTLTTQVSNFQNELDAFYLMWAGARVAAALAPPQRAVAAQQCLGCARRLLGH